VKRGIPLRDVARLPRADRFDLFADTSAKMHLNENIVEKDFWVCWALDVLFSNSPWKESLNFKGGTSLSKGYNLIHRFSEDIDLIIDWRLLGYSRNEPWLPRSNTAQDKFVQQANKLAIDFIAEDFVPRMRLLFSESSGTEIEVKAEDHNVYIFYPRVFATSYIKPYVFLEMGAMAAWVPCGDRPISPYAANFHPELFRVPTTLVRTVAAERTFWEKVTILHQEANRAPEKSLPQRYSRHYYDLYAMAESPLIDSALSHSELLRDVVEFKQRFYRASWARFEESLSGNLRLVPPESRFAELKSDYGAMKEMIFGDVPDFEDIMAVLRRLEQRANTAIRAHHEAAL
jgi:hypothetical protein